jgi:hypothetical protein
MRYGRGDKILAQLRWWWQDNCLGEAEPQELQHCPEKNVPPLPRRIPDVGIGMQERHIQDAPVQMTGMQNAHKWRAKTKTAKVGHHLAR